MELLFISMLDKLSAIYDRYIEVEKLISSSDAMNDMAEVMYNLGLLLFMYERICIY